MNRNLMACRILESAETDLRSVVQLLTTAQPEQLESAQRLLERMVGTLGEIEAAARRDSLLPIKTALNGFRSRLGHAGALSNLALKSIDRQATLAGLALGGSTSTLCAEG